MGIGSDATVPTKRRVVREKKKLRVVKSMVGWSKVLQSIGLYAKWCIGSTCDRTKGVAPGADLRKLQRRIRLSVRVMGSV